jgi:hypothetical protein
LKNYVAHYVVISSQPPRRIILENPAKERTGMFTTGILSRTDQRDIALFYNSTMHAGENMEKLLKKRDAKAGEIIQMCEH